MRANAAQDVSDVNPTTSTRHAPPRRVMLLTTQRLSGSSALANQIADRLQKWQVESSIAAVDAEDLEPQLAGIDLALALGGDGTMLRAGCLTASHNIPVLGVNLGRLGFLAEVQPDEWPDALARVMAGDYWLERRAMLRAELERDGSPPLVFDVLNEVFVGRGLTGRTVRVDAYIDGGLFMKYVADGVIVATATGSTAYALAAGGPVLPPELKNILLVAVAPHMVNERPIVLDEDTTVELRAVGEHSTVLIADGGLPVDLTRDDRVRVHSSPYACRFVRVQPRSYFYRTLMARLARNPAAELETNPNR
jgi:NAD+ kinase